MEKFEGIQEWKNFAAFIHGALNDRDSAHRHANARLEEIPWENREYYWAAFAYYRRPQDIELIIESAAKAGIPRFAYGFDPGERKPLDNIAISALTSKGLWHGTTFNGNEFFQQFTPGNSIAIRTDITMMSGSYYIENSKLCVIFPSVLLDLPDCGYIYPDVDNHGYTWVTVGDVYQFTVNP